MCGRYEMHDDVTSRYAQKQSADVYIYHTQLFDNMRRRPSHIHTPPHAGGLHIYVTCTVSKLHIYTHELHN